MQNNEGMEELAKRLAKYPEIQAQVSRLLNEVEKLRKTVGAG